ncbi:hypothetical protein Gpo141_00004814 [Globisporangium polare]
MGEHEVAPVSAAVLAAMPVTTIITTAAADDGEAQLKREYDELHGLLLETQQDRRELTAQYRHVQKQLERAHTENEYLMGELSQYAASDLESDQSDIEASSTSRPRKAPPSSPSAAVAESDDPAASKSKSAAASNRATEDATQPKRKRSSSAASSLPATSKKVSRNR